jgi:hypothetical protein
MQMKIPNKLICSIFNLKHYDSPDVRELQLSVHSGGGGGVDTTVTQKSAHHNKRKLQ